MHDKNRQTNTCQNILYDLEGIQTVQAYKRIEHFIIRPNSAPATLMNLLLLIFGTVPG